MKFPTQKQTGSMCPCISHDTIVNTYLNTTKSRTPYHKQYITQKNRRTLAQLRTKRCPLLLSYLNKIAEDNPPLPLCPLCKSEPHTTTHLFNCTNINTQLKITEMWTTLVEAGNLLVEWRGSPVSQRARMPARRGDTIGRYA